MLSFHLHSAVDNRIRLAPVPLCSAFDQRAGASAEVRLEGKRILVVEDEFLLADEIVDWLTLRGAEPLGPAGTLRQALTLIEHDMGIDLAVLDINLAGVMVFPLALELERRRVPLLFASAYAEEMAFPDELKTKTRLKKPFSEAQLIRAVESVLDTAD